MSDKKDDNEKTSTIRDEFNELGQNIRDVFGNAWDSQEKQDLQIDIKNGLNEFGDSLSKLSDDLHIKDLTKKVVDGVGGIGDRVRSGELEDKTRTDILRALQNINKSLTKVSSKFTPKSNTPEASEETEKEVV